MPVFQLQEEDGGQVQSNSGFEYDSVPDNSDHAHSLFYSEDQWDNAGGWTLRSVERAFVQWVLFQIQESSFLALYPENIRELEQPLKLIE